jgi:AmiR/NasT family two-component response regulator
MELGDPVTLTPTASDFRSDTEALDRARETIANLESALRSCRLIGMAVGIVMERCKIGEDEAFDLLIDLSQTDDRPLPDIAAQLVRSGAIPELRR